MFKLIKRYERYRAYQNTVRELNRLTDRELNDLGISRNDIHRAAQDAQR